MDDPSIYEIYLFIANLIKTAGVRTPVPKMILKGIEIPSLEGVDEWIAFELLLQNPYAARRIQREESIHFQLTCFTVDSDRRADKKIGVQYDLANLYKPVLHQRDYMLKNTCIRFKECKMTFLDLRTSTFTAKAISTGGTPPLQTQSAVILSEACIITKRD